MASLKVKFRPSTIAGHEGCIYYRVIHQRMARQLSTEYRIFAEEWDEKRGQIITKNDSPRLPLILSIQENIRKDVERLSRINQYLIRRKEKCGINYTSDDIISEFGRYEKEYSLFSFMKNIITKKRQNGKIRTSETYRSALNSFRSFRDQEDIMLDAITSETMEEYEAWLKDRGVIPNTIGFYTRILRAVYNRAVEDQIIENRFPFRKVYTGVDKTVKRALPLNIIKKMNNLDLSANPPLEFARDMFLMSFFLRGMSFVDMAYLKKTDLRHGIVTYRRRKTGQQLLIGWEPEMQKILDKYPANESDHLLPIITNPATSKRNAYRNKGYNINHNLKKIAGMLGITVPLTLYVARHSWATAAKTKGVPLSIISEGMGHDSETTTRIYLASLDTTAVDKANSLILKSLKKK